MSYFKLYLYMFTAISCFVQVVGFSKLYFGLFIFLILLYLNRKISTISYLIFCMLLPNKAIQFISLFVYIIFNYKSLTKVRNKYIFNFIYIIIISTLINILFFEGSIINFLLQLAIYVVYLLVIYCLKIDEINQDVFLENLKGIFFSQIIISILQLLIYKDTGDCITGSFLSAHYYGVFLILFLYKYINSNKLSIKKGIVNKESILFIGLVIFELIIADAKHVYLAFIISIIIYLVINSMKIKNIVVVSGIVLLIGVISAIQIFKVPQVEIYMKKNYVDESQYIYRSGYNQKYLYFDRTLETLIPFRGILGLGIGQYGSQIANFRAYETIYKEGGVGKRSEIIDPYITDEYKNNVADLMTKEYVTNIKNVSMVMSFPIVSFIPFIAELGIVGYILFLLVLQKLIKKNEDSIFIIFFLMLTIFDIYFEVPCIFILIVVFAFYTEPLQLRLKRRKQ